MTAITTYFAEDGKKFDNEWDCVEYERTLKSNQFKDTAFLFDSEGYQLPLSDAGFEDCVFILCKTDEAAKYIHDNFNTGFLLPWDYKEAVRAGAWVYDEKDGWEKLEDLIPFAKVIIQISELQKTL